MSLPLDGVIVVALEQAVAGPFADRHRALRSPIEIDGVEPAAGPVPALGEHTDQVLAWVDELERAAS